MFLSKKGFAKVLIMVICYIALGTFSIASWIFFALLGSESALLLILGLATYLTCALIALWGLYAEGKGKLLNTAQKLVRVELRPAEFIKQYEALRSSTDLVINKPSFEALQMLAIAYDALDDRESCLETVKEMIAAAPAKKKVQAELFYVSILFSYERKEEAERLFNEVQTRGLDAVSRMMVDSILKSDRAMVMGDYKTVELYNLQLLERSFPKLDNLGKLIVNYKLGEVYEKLGETEEAIARYEYCAENGGETAIRTAASTAIIKLQTNKSSDI
ncbi:MAG: hypothetical protein IIV11_03825 [Clostridia bacterium]|nr:hypothetical protein [Clostridia bacterium]